MQGRGRARRLRCFATPSRLAMRWAVPRFLACYFFAGFANCRAGLPLFVPRTQKRSAEKVLLHADLG